ncbi:MAG TPA: BsuPI-related putative proteinase inhibitor [Longimicrobiales bacterium]|nr:BsuPI-related putative proteinase inhibitor [Longimicrobiales bacterium]
MQTRMLPGLVLSLLVGCTSSGDPQEPADAALLVRADGVEYSADTAVMESFPVQLRTTVTATNRSSRTIDLTFPDGCVVLLRVYRDEARTELAWDQAEHVGCTMALVEWSLAPGASRQATVQTDAAAILGTTLPDGRYWLAAVLRPEGRSVEVPAGPVDLAVPR